MRKPKPLLTESDLVDLLVTRKETSTQDYRRELPPRGHRICSVLDLLRDIVAIANMGGGAIVFGVEDESYELVGLKSSRERKRLDETDITRAVRQYLDAELHVELTFYEYRGKQFAFLAVGGAEMPPVFRRAAECEVCKENAAARHFPAGSTFIRQGSSTVRASDAWVMEKIHDVKLVQSLTSGQNVVAHNLPSRHSIYDTFVGRMQPFESAIGLLLDDRRRVTWIQGSGGIGKTTLAYRIAENIVTATLASRIDYVVWISAKRPHSRSTASSPGTRHSRGFRTSRSLSQKSRAWWNCRRNRSVA